MKRKLRIFAGLFLCGILAAGCGKKQETVDETPQATQTLTPTPTPTPAAEKSNLVNMQKITQEPEKNVIGTKTSTSAKLVIYNKTGIDIASLYVRRSPEDSGDSDWGEDLIQSKFTLKTGDRAVYYHEKGTEDQLYDIRIEYTDENAGTCYFRMLPINDISQISLCLDDNDGDAIPFARYVSTSSKRELSTLNEVKKRLGLVDSEDDTIEETETPTPIPDPTEPPEDDPDDEPDEEPDPAAEQAEEYIGMSLNDLIAAMGEPNGASYEDEPETGETGYHYYDTFTVSTTVDEEGNEVVAGIW